jgi:hypothetical protein
MTAEDVLEVNGDFSSSPLLDTARRLHRLFSEMQIPYAIIGGLAVIRNGAVRTTIDVDVLVRKQDWPEIRRSLSGGFMIEVDGAVDQKTQVPVDFLYAGDDWDMVVPLPDPEKVSEYDDLLQVNVMSLPAILELKAAVYLQKKRDDGIEIAAKDLADVVELLRSNRERLTAESYAAMHPRVRRELERIQRKLRRRGSR